MWTCRHLPHTVLVTQESSRARRLRQAPQPRSNRLAGNNLRSTSQLPPPSLSRQHRKHNMPPHLPEELLDRIIYYAAAWHPAYSSWIAQRYRETLLSICLASKTLCRLARPHLYKALRRNQGFVLDPYACLRDGTSSNSATSARCLRAIPPHSLYQAGVWRHVSVAFSQYARWPFVQCSAARIARGARRLTAVPTTSAGLLVRHSRNRYIPESAVPSFVEQDT